MGIKNSLKKLSSVGLYLASASIANAANLPMNTAQMQALDKITGQMSVIEVPVNGEVKFGSFSVVVRDCQSTPPEEVPENYAFIDVADTDRDGHVFNIFKGWMVSSSPSLNSVEHPIYDVWLLKCHNTKIDTAKLLSSQQLAERDNLEKFKAQDLSKEAKIAIQAAEQQAKQEEEAKAALEEQDKKKEEEKELHARQLEIEKEIQNSEQQAIIDSSDTDGEGPVSLLNIGQKEFDEPSKNSSATELMTEPQNLSQPSAAVVTDVTDGLVVIEDTHHETIDQPLDIPADVEEILPQTQSQE